MLTFLGMSAGGLNSSVLTDAIKIIRIGCIGFTRWVCVFTEWEIVGNKLQVFFVDIYH